MKDRISRYPGRVELTPVPGQPNVFDLHRADEPIEEGTPLNKASLLTDATATLYGYGKDAVPDDVLISIKAMLDEKAKISTGSYIGTGTYGEEAPCSLTFDFVPKLVVVALGQSYQYGLFWHTGNTISNMGASAAYDKIITQTGKTLSWYSSGRASYQLNETGITYHYLVIG